jgi:hypothetical protein
MIESILPLNNYSELAGIMTDCSILIKLIKIYLPNLFNHLNEIGYELSLNNVLYKWFVSVYIQNLSYELSITVWDVLFLEGNITMFKGALAILKIIKDKILSLDNIEDVNDVFDYTIKHLNENYTLLYYLILRRFEFDSEYISKNRKLIEPEIIENISRNNEFKIQRYSIKEEDSDRRRGSFVKPDVDCFREWPLCIFDHNYKYEIIDCFTFKILTPPNLIDDYFYHSFYKKNKSINVKKSITDENDKVKYSSLNELLKPNILEKSKSDPYENFSMQDEFKMRVYADLLIERRTHFCDDKDREISIKFCERPSYIQEDKFSHQVEFLDNRFEIMESYVSRMKPSIIDINEPHKYIEEIKKESSIFKYLFEEIRRSLSMARTKNFPFKKETNDDISLCQILSNFNNCKIYLN